MFYNLAAGAVLLVHLGFILFVLAGSALALRRQWVVAIHLPAATWGVLVELTGRGCPLTQVENFLLLKAGHTGYSGSFVEHYLLPLIYPSAMTREIQIMLAAAVLVVNLSMYAWLFVFRPLRTHSRARRLSRRLKS